MLDKKIEAILYLLALVCFILAATGWGGSRRKISPLAIGLALWIFPLMWNSFNAAF